jgi:hypothetical protein
MHSTDCSNHDFMDMGKQSQRTVLNTLSTQQRLILSCIMCMSSNQAAPPAIVCQQPYLLHCLIVESCRGCKLLCGFAVPEVCQFSLQSLYLFGTMTVTGNQQLRLMLSSPYNNSTQKVNCQLFLLL